ncbi:uncharacterized protein K460DRAFT_359509 [Cucurbitaria berberidis CBS 394.84]|uniref:Uncharacterized protein n=1 Tax=Cucurbitaria berberidis CBS 394.84 TaxID=1168544 RepID=A0A9P4G943_9PLEO|nr:uncharacterized protein K460DRAFT_359509 [Cucurbitaria berberidis CBS 394.84]KAF1840969.1 hypothetical protein K460DRAFT_359509 [Cucurbitaria berberidis CBS 394.84]
MRLFSALLLSLIGVAIAAPAGSKKNVYLATCTTRGPECSIPILCSSLDNTSPSDTAAAETFSAVIYYNGPAKSRSSPTDVGTVSSPSRPWEGATRRASLDIAGAFEGKIDADAAALSKSQIAGSAKLGKEELVCFKDGEATFKFGEGLLALRSVNCRADYWCGSISV